MRARGWAVGAVVVIVGLAGCAPREAPVIPASPPPDAELVCGMALDSVALATGKSITPGSELPVADDFPCFLRTGDDSVQGLVLVSSADSAEGSIVLQRIADSHANLRYPTGIQGGIWNGARERVTSYVAVGDYVVQIRLETTGRGRSVGDDLLALTRQVVATMDLGDL